MRFGISNKNYKLNLIIKKSYLANIFRLYGETSQTTKD